MKIELHHDDFLRQVERAFDQALDDAAAHAAGLPGSPSDLRAEHIGPMHGRIGSDKDYAMAQERGAFIRPRRARVLKFASGRFSKRARIKGTRYLDRTGRRWGAILLPRLRAVGGGR